jgi:hypothetical protein
LYWAVALLAPSQLEHQPARVDVQGRGQGAQGRAQPGLGLARVDRARRFVFLHVQPVAIAGL